VFLVRGLLPWLILWISTLILGFLGSFTASFSSDPAVIKAMQDSFPILLVGGGTFLVFLFFHWLFLVPKYYVLIGEEFIQKHGAWFFAIVSVLLVTIVWVAIRFNPLMALGAVIGSSAFFISYGFKANAEQAEKRIIANSSTMSDISKFFTWK